MYESRPGETFLLGASTWRIEDITFERVVVTPAPGAAGQDAVLARRPPRPPARARPGPRRRSCARSGSCAPAQAAERLRDHYALDAWAASNVLLVPRRAGRGHRRGARRPHGRRRALPRRDRRLAGVPPQPVRHAGARAVGDGHRAPPDGALRAARSRRCGATTASSSGCPRRPTSCRSTSCSSTPTRSTSWWCPRCPRPRCSRPASGSARRGRCCCPVAGPTPRTPLWQQRQRAADLLAVAAKYPTLPDPAGGQPGVPAGRVRRAGAARGAGPAPRAGRSAWSASTRRRRRRSRRACCSTGSPPTCTRATRRWPSGGRRRSPSTATCCASCWAPRSCASCSTPACSPTSSSSCSASPTDGGRASADELHDVLRKLGDLQRRRARPARRGDRDRRGVAGRARRRAAGHHCPHRRRGADDRGRGRGPLPRRARLRHSRSACRRRSPSRCARPARAAGRPVRAHPRALPRRRRRPAGSGCPGERVAGALAALEAEDRVVRGEFRPDGVAREWCDVEVLRQLRRRSLAALRREVEPVEPAALGPVPPGVARHPGPVAAASRRWSRRWACCRARRSWRRRSSATCSRARVPGYRPADLDELCTAGDLVWVGAGALGLGATGGCGCASATSCRCWRRRSPDARPAGRRAARRACGTHLGRRGRVVLATSCVAPRPAPPTPSCSPPCGTWCGPARSPTTRSRRCGPCRRRPGRPARRGRAAPAGRRGRPRPGRLTRIGPPAGAGRWSLVAPLLRAGARRRPRRPTPGAAAARALRRAHPRGGAGRGHRGRLRAASTAC